jgi:hypothetical protein
MKIFGSAPNLPLAVFGLLDQDVVRNCYRKEDCSVIVDEFCVAIQNPLVSRSILRRFVDTGDGVG